MSTLSPAAHRASRALERISRLLRERESEAGLNPAQWEALRYLAGANRYSRSPSAVARWIATTRGTASQTLISLEGKGLLVRIADERDKRACRLDLTAAGWAMLDADPVAGVAQSIASLQPLHAIALGQALAQILGDLLGEGRHSNFGACGSCRQFIPASDDGGRCGRFNAAVDAQEAALACAAQEAA